ncbi:MAG: hypothetical protein ABI811_17125 [Acidobacteriota bacterium]
MARIFQLGFLLAILLAPSAWAQRPMSVAQLRQFIKSSIDLKQSDRQVADLVKTLKMTERLDARTVEDMQGLGAGARTIEALKLLSSASLTLAPPKPLAPPPPAAPKRPDPSVAEQQRILEEVTTNANDYTSGLPNFICTQMTRRHVDPSGNGAWRTADVIQEQLTFVDKKEEYKVVLVNNLPVTTLSHQQLGGTTSSGEFGTMLAQIFKPATKTEFRWDHWATLRGRLTHVFSFRVLQRNSDYLVADDNSGRQMIAGYNGWIYADAETKMVMRINMDLDGLENFPIRKVNLDLNYDFVEISGQRFVLPLKAELRSTADNRFSSRNEVEFRMYQKFTADAKILFDIPDEIPQDQLQESPIH